MDEHRTITLGDGTPVDLLVKPDVSPETVVALGRMAEQALQAAHSGGLVVRDAAAGEASYRIRRRALVYDIPLRPDFNAQLVLPYDLSRREAARLSALLTTLVATWAERPDPAAGEVLEEP